MDDVDSGQSWDDFQQPLRRWASVSSSSSVSRSFSQHSYHYTRTSTSVESDMQSIKRNPSYSSRDSVLSPTGSDVTGAGSDITGNDITPAQEVDYWSQGAFDDLDSGMGSSNFDDADSGVGSSHYEELAELGSNSYYSPVSVPSHFRTVGYGVVSIKPQGLSKLLRSGMEKYLLIDCRSFLEYNTSHIQQSTNVCCSKLVKRRLQKDKVQIHDLLMQSCHIDIEEFVEVIVYDQCTENLSLLSDDNFLCVLLTKLCTTYKRVALLKGGFLAFQAMYPSLCESKTNSYRCTALTSLSQPCLPVSNVGPTRILPFLYLGSQQDALSPDIVQVNEITYIINVSTTCMKPAYISEGHFLRIPVNDNYSARLQPYFNEAFQFLDKVREANGCCLIHCLAGISRSPTLAIAYIMKHLNMSSDDAYRYVKDKRPTISPNFNFLGQLLEYEKQIKRERELNNNTEGALSLKSESRLWSNYVMDLSSHSPSSPASKAARAFFFGTSDQPSEMSKDKDSSSSKLLQDSTCENSKKEIDEKPITSSKTQSIDQSFQRIPITSELSKVPQSSGSNVKDKADFFMTFPIKHESKMRPNVLNLGFEPPWRMQSSLTICKESSVSTMSSSLTEIKETKESETPSPVCSTSSEMVPFSTSGVSNSTHNTRPLSTQMYCRRGLKALSPLSHSDTYVRYSGRRSEGKFATPFSRVDVKDVKDLPSPFPCGESTVRELPSPFPCGESTVRDLPSPFPCGESTVREFLSPFPNAHSASMDLLSPSTCEDMVWNFSSRTKSDQKTSAGETSESGKTHSVDVITSSVTTTSMSVLPSTDKMQSCESSQTESKTNTCSSAGNLAMDTFLKSRGKRPLRSRLSLSLSPITPLRSTTTTKMTSSVNSGETGGAAVLETCEPSACKIERKLCESDPNVSLCDSSNIPLSLSSRIRSSSSFSSLSTSSSSFSTTTSRAVKLKSFDLPSPTTNPRSLPAQSPTSSLARLHFSSAENSDTEIETSSSMDVSESLLPLSTDCFSSHSSIANLDKGLHLLSSFESTSLDKLNFTPCLSNSVENVQVSPNSSRCASLKRPLHDSSGKDLDNTCSPISPHSSSGGSNRSSLSPTASCSTTTKVVMRKREGRVKRTLVRPNSIAFSSYPTFDLGSDCQDSPHSSSSSASQDDSSASYSISGKKSKPSDYLNDVKFRLGRYSEREMYRQITAAMETAMLKTQVYEATRKSRSLDDILSSEDDSSAPNCESSRLDLVLRHCALMREHYVSPTHIFEKFACKSGLKASEPYHSSSSLSSASSHTSLHGSMELIQVS